MGTLLDTGRPGTYLPFGFSVAGGHVGSSPAALSFATFQMLTPPLSPAASASANGAEPEPPTTAIRGHSGGAGIPGLAAETEITHGGDASRNSQP